MRIKKIHITGFGIHENATWQSGAGMSVFFGLNERGKTTIAKFIEFILYGEDALGGRKAANTYEPVGRAVHGGFLEVESCGRALTIARAFGKKNSLTVTDESGNSVPPAEFETTLRHHVSRDNFAGVFSMDVDDLAAAPDNGDALGGIFFDTLGGGAGVSAQAARDRIRTIKNSIYTPNRKSQTGNRMFDLMQRLDELRREIDAAKSKASEYERLVRERDDILRRRELHEGELESATSRLRENKALLSLLPHYQEYTAALAARDAAATVKDFPADGLHRLNAFEEDLQENEKIIRVKEEQGRAYEVELDRTSFDPRWIDHETEILSLFRQKPVMEKEREQLAGDKRQLEETGAKIAQCMARHIPGAAREEIEQIGAGLPERGEAAAAIKRLRHARENVRAHASALSALEKSLRDTDAEIEVLRNSLTRGASVSGDMPPETFRARIMEWRRAHENTERLEQERAFAARSLEDERRRAPHAPVPRALSMPLIIGGVLLIVFGMLLALLRPVPGAAGVAIGLITAAAGAALLFAASRMKTRAEDSSGGGNISDLERKISEIGNEMQSAREAAATTLRELRIEHLDRNTADNLLQQLSDQQAIQRAVQEEIDRKRIKRAQQEREKSEYESGPAADAERQLGGAERALSDLRERLRLPEGVAADAVLEMQSVVGELKELFEKEDGLRTGVAARAGELKEYSERARHHAALLGLAGAESADPFALVETLHEELDRQRKAGAARDALKKDIERNTNERGALLVKQADLQRKLDALLAAGGAPGDQAAFRARADQFAAFRRAESEMATRHTALMAGRPAHEDEEQFLKRLEIAHADGAERIQAEINALETQKRDIEDARDGTIREQTTIDNAIKELLDYDELKNMEQEYEGLLQELGELAQTWNRLALAERIMCMVADEDEKNRMPDIKRDAAALFAAFTGGEYDGLRIDTAQRTVHAMRGGMDAPVPHLSRSVRHELYLALRFAQVLHLARAAAAPAETMPVLLDDVFVDIDDNRLPRVVRAIAEAFKPLKTQIIHFTAHEHIRDVFTDIFGVECIVLL